eukprot:356699-Chlamydomonas_euryale.AAC.2
MQTTSHNPACLPAARHNSTADVRNSLVQCEHFPARCHSGTIATAVTPEQSLLTFACHQGK